MRSYKVTLTLNERELLKFLDRPEAVTMTVETAEGEEPAVNEPEAEAIYRPKRAQLVQRRPRRSKVIDTITGVLAEGPAEAAALKQALVNAGLSPGSLGTGIQILRKDGAIGHDEEGRYFLTRSTAEAAE